MSFVCHTYGNFRCCYDHIDSYDIKSNDFNGSSQHIAGYNFTFSCTSGMHSGVRIHVRDCFGTKETDKTTARSL